MVVVPAVVEGISCCAAVAVDAEPVLEVLVGHVEVVVFGILSDSIEIFKINSQLHFLAPCQEMNFVIAQPKLPAEVSKAMFVVIPGSVEVSAAILTPLQHRPTAALCLHVTVNFKALIFGIRANPVDSIIPSSCCVMVSTVSLHYLYDW